MRIPDPRDRPWLTVTELAEITGEGEKVIRYAVAHGQLPRLNIGRYVRIPTHELLIRLGMALSEATETAVTVPVGSAGIAAVDTNQRRPRPSSHGIDDKGSFDPTNSESPAATAELFATTEPVEGATNNGDTTRLRSA